MGHPILTAQLEDTNSTLWHMGDVHPQFSSLLPVGDGSNATSGSHEWQEPSSSASSSDTPSESKEEVRLTSSPRLWYRPQHIWLISLGGRRDYLTVKECKGETTSHSLSLMWSYSRGECNSYNSDLLNVCTVLFVKSLFAESLASMHQTAGSFD